MKKNRLFLVMIAFFLMNVSAQLSFGKSVDAERKLDGIFISAAGGVQANAFDGDFSTFYESSDGLNGWIGLDLGSSVVISSIKVAPRLDFVFRMDGGVLQGANNADFSDAVDLYTIPTPAVYLANELTVIPITNTTGFRYVRYKGTAEWNFSCIAELEFWTMQPYIAPTSMSISSNITVYKVDLTANLNAVFLPANASNQKVSWSSSDELMLKVSASGEVSCLGEGKFIIYATSDADNTMFAYLEIEVLASPETATKLTGTILGTLGSWSDNPATTRDAVFDGDVTTFFDSNQGDFSWVGLDFGTPQVITKFKISPRENYTHRMLNGEIQGSNSETFEPNTVIFVLADELTFGKLSTIEVTDKTPYRYARYLCPAESYGGISELSFWNGSTVGVPSKLASEIAVYPNPLIEGNATINLTGFENERNIKLRLIDLNGKVILSKTVTNSSISINRTGLTSGLYCISISTDKGVKNLKLLVK